MPLYFYLYFFIVALIAGFFIRYLILRKKNLSEALFVKARRMENDGLLTEAVMNYESALVEAKKIRFHSRFRAKIVDKLKVLHTYIDYNNNVLLIHS